MPLALTKEQRIERLKATVPALPNPKPRSPSAVIKNAIHVLKTGHWTRGRDVDLRTGAMCALGALNYGAGSPLDDIEVDLSVSDGSFPYNGNPAYLAAKRWVEEQTSDGNIVSFNDYRVTSKRQVIQAFEQALDRR